jgi:uncharacterized integral membrane protein
MNICVRQEIYGIILILILYFIFIINDKKVISVSLPIEKMHNVSIFDYA